MNFVLVEFFTIKKSNAFLDFYFFLIHTELLATVNIQWGCLFLFQCHSVMLTFERRNKLWTIPFKSDIYSLQTFPVKSGNSSFPHVVFFPLVNVWGTPQVTCLTRINSDVYYSSLYLSLVWFLFLTMQSMHKTSTGYSF